MSNSVSASGGNLDGATDTVYTFSRPVKVAKITVSPDAAVGVHGKWDSTDCAADDYDFYCAPGDTELSPPYTRVKTVSLFATSSLTYDTDYSVRGFLEL